MYIFFVLRYITTYIYIYIYISLVIVNFLVKCVDVDIEKKKIQEISFFTKPIRRQTNKNTGIYYKSK